MVKYTIKMLRCENLKIFEVYSYFSPLCMKKLINTFLQEAVVRRISNYIDSDKCKLLVNAYVKSQFIYCPLMWMFYALESSYSLNWVHERALRIIWEDYISSFCDLLTLLNKAYSSEVYINVLMTEVIKHLDELSPGLINELFKLKSNYHNLFQPTHNLFQPTHNLFQPTHNLFQPTRHIHSKS